MFDPGGHGFPQNAGDLIVQKTFSLTFYSRNLHRHLPPCFVIRSLVLALAGLAAIGTLGIATRRPELLLDKGKIDSIPFQTGEKLSYKVNWKPLAFTPAFKVGELSMSIEESQYQKRPTYTVSAWAISDGLLNSLFGLEVKDYFESTIDRHAFRSYRWLKKTREGQRKRDLEVFFEYDQNHIRVRETDLATNPPKEIRNETISGIPWPVTDILSIFYVARLRAMQLGEEYFIYLSDSGKPEQIRVKVLDREEVRTVVGKFDAVKISTTDGIFRGGGNFRIWYSTDQLRIPVKFEGDVKFGKVYGTLIRVQTERMSQGLIRAN